MVRMTDAGGDPHDYLPGEAEARVEIDRMLAEAGWVVQDASAANRGAGLGVAIREFTMAEGHGRADYLLFVDRRAVGVMEARKAGACYSTSNRKRRSTQKAYHEVPVAVGNRVRHRRDEREDAAARYRATEVRLVVEHSPILVAIV